MQSVRGGEAKSRFSELISRAAAGERFLIERRERPVAVLISVSELERLEQASHIALRMALALGQDADLLSQVEAEEIHPAMAAFGLWRGAEDLATLADERGWAGIASSVSMVDLACPAWPAVIGRLTSSFPFCPSHWLRASRGRQTTPSLYNPALAQLADLSVRSSGHQDLARRSVPGQRSHIRCQSVRSGGRRRFSRGDGVQ